MLHMADWQGLGPITLDLWGWSSICSGLASCRQSRFISAAPWGSWVTPLDVWGLSLPHVFFRSWGVGLWLPTPTNRHMEKLYEHKCTQVLRHAIMSCCCL